MFVVNIRTSSRCHSIPLQIYSMPLPVCSLRIANLGEAFRKFREPTRAM
uniref:Uncharacterized protein n=1 Tax=Vibrio tasmaniensis TaxID=212663 RepID=A0A0H3ZSD7_9VIBR|nr:hypothetical protein [Vibrio tasmaniensis]AKN36975.1 hypothetical protein [Vibrio tasmaniensis]AKN36986.1 hypothetical protein [Vibrio tasmaniensis]